MERFFRISLSAFGVLFVVALLTLGGCSGEDSPTNPNPIDTTDNNDTTGNQDTNTVTIDERIRPVIFVHGTNEAADVFTQLVQRFALNGYTEAQLVAFDFESYFTGSEIDIAKMAAQLQTRVNAMLAGTTEKRVDVVAHGSGANAVQHWLVNMGGTDKAAHVAFVGGSYDLALTVAGDITPGSCEYLTLRSDGKDAIQNGNSQYGSLTGATNEVYAGYDNLQLVSEADPFERMFRFFTGGAPTEKNMPNSRIGMSYDIKARVVDFIDNTPISGATVVPMKIRVLSNGEIQRQSSTTVLTSDVNGEISFSDIVGPDQHIELWVRSGTQAYYDMHIYRQPWRANSHTERLRVIPRSPSGSDPLRAYAGAMRTGNHAIMAVMSQNRTLQHGRDNITVRRYNSAYDPIGEAAVLTQGNAPVPGGTAQNGNTWFVSLFDYDNNGSDGTGPIAAPGLNLWGINSFDCYLDATTTNFQTQFDLNGTVLGVFNYRSSNQSGGNNAGINIVQFEY
ncbi:MAG: hypothetical protein KFF77_06095 [Bacteroidetes bacterium]|nr:hypothetical protein [Bacteroidota bacterium]